MHSILFQGQHLPRLLRVGLLLITVKAGGCIFREQISVEMREMRKKKREKATLGRKSDIARSKEVKEKKKQ